MPTNPNEPRLQDHSAPATPAPPSRPTEAGNPNEPKQQVPSARVSPEPPCQPTESRKPKVFVASSTPGRKYIGEELVEALRADKENFADIIPWWEDQAFPAGGVILDSLLDQAEKADFAVVLFTADDFEDKDGKKTPRDNCIFELGLFMGALGLQPRRSILLRHPESRLLSDLGGVLYIDLPPNKTTDEEWKAFLDRAVARIKGSVKDLSYCFNRAPRKGPRIIPKARLMDLEKRGKNLMDSDAVEVLVNTMQPMELNHNIAKGVCENMSLDVTYRYFFLADPASIKFFSSLVGALAAAKLEPPLPAPKTASDKDAPEQNENPTLNITQWRDLMAQNADTVSDVLKIMRKQLRIYFVPRKPELEYCVHNANHKEEAICYLRHTADSFIEWFKGQDAKYVAEELRTCRFPDENDIVFQGTQGYELYGRAYQRFFTELVTSTLDRFPKGDLRDEAMDVCFGNAVRICVE